ncbi:hypothetical protein EYF88_07230 [Paracoccus sediminis]|uniref:Glycosyltransferase family 29 (Sialyltransferase) n=1 Tax=Paracoccus sediminis TaxID=1214787 RepID=A0A238W744_9RHOB|nr:hypothetical protein [Paracoccus sediminis]TBN51573.1 hypothetical protein EYF88_07230 [Paracoccus sediminis]SNR41519.1 hypothetical protein SAMN06265378_103358 [Paracoccus sediminis]
MHPIARLIARHAPKPLRPLAYRFLYRRLMAEFALDPALFAGRRVLIAGPARTIDSDLAGLDPGRFDLVVRMNNGLDTPIAAFADNPYRCEVLFHSLTRDARPVTPEHLRRAGVATLVHRVPKRSVFLRTIAFLDRLDPATRLRIVPVDHYDALSRSLGGYSPTTGLVCASVILQALPDTLAICGFTFFDTRYVAHYDDADRSDADTAQRVRSQGHHAPHREAGVLMTMVGQARARGVTVMLGQAVQEAAERIAERERAAEPMPRRP